MIQIFEFYLCPGSIVTWGCPSISSHSFYCDLPGSQVTQGKIPVRKGPRRNAALIIMIICNQDLSF